MREGFRGQCTGKMLVQRSLGGRGVQGVTVLVRWRFRGHQVREGFRGYCTGKMGVQRSPSRRGVQGLTTVQVRWGFTDRHHQV